LRHRFEENPTFFTNVVFFVLGEPEISIRTAGHVLANQLREIEKPLSQRPNVITLPFGNLFDSKHSKDVSVRELPAGKLKECVDRTTAFPRLYLGIEHLYNSYLDMLGRTASIEAMLTAQAYQRQRNELPQKLEDLIPDYIDSVPLDPADPNSGTLRYRRESPNSAVVWSIGIDKIDNDGDVESETGQPIDVGFRLKIAE